MGSRNPVTSQGKSAKPHKLNRVVYDLRSRVALASEMRNRGTEVASQSVQRRRA